MLSKTEFQEKIAAGLHFLDGATGSNLRNAGMPKDCCAEQWILEHPEPLVRLQREYAQAGCQIIYAPTFQAQPLALKAAGLHRQTEAINEALVALSRSAAPGCLIAGDLTTMASVCNSWNPDSFDTMVENYRRQIRGLIDGGADLLAAETLLYPQEAEAILTAAELENARAVMYSFTMDSGGALFSGADPAGIFRDLEQAGAAAVGFNCVAASCDTPALVSKLRRYTRLPLICKPNAGNPVVTENGVVRYPMDAEEFVEIAVQCARNGAALLGGCCGTTPEFLSEMIRVLRQISNFPVA